MNHQPEPALVTELRQAIDLYATASLHINESHRAEARATLDAALGKITALIKERDDVKQLLADKAEELRRVWERCELAERENAARLCSSTSD